MLPDLPTQVLENLGDRIPGSRFFRNFCCRCGEPFRVDSEQRLARDLLCEGCDPPPLPPPLPDRVTVDGYNFPRARLGMRVDLYGGFR